MYQLTECARVYHFYLVCIGLRFSAQTEREEELTVKTQFGKESS